MGKPSWPPVTLAVLLLLALVAGLSYFAGLTTPSSYPEMSSLNSGPQGTKLLFDALSSMRPLSVRRNYLPFGRWRPSSSTVLVLSLWSSVLNLASKEDLVEIETLMRANNRVVLCIPDDSSPGKSDGKKMPLIKTRWGIQVFQKEAAKKGDDPELILDYDSSWQPVSGLDDAVEKQFGAGSVVVALHSDDFSNESLATDSSYLAEVPLLIGRHTSVVFDETHFGIEESGSIAGLARHYKLQGLIAGLLILVGLFIWNQSVSFPPPTQFESSRETQVLGADARKTFAGLIARHLSPQALIESCVAEWNRVKPQQRIKTEVSGKIDPVARYRQLQESLPKRSSRT
jgi:hypothetical protein